MTDGVKIMKRELVVVALGELYADECAVCGCIGDYGLASVHGPEGCVEAVRRGRVYCKKHLPPNDDGTTTERT